MKKSQAKPRAQSRPNFQASSSLYENRYPTNLPSSSNKGFVPFSCMLQKDTREINHNQGKYSQLRNRDFTSQIQTIPGPKSIKGRKYEEQKLLWKKKFDLRKKDNQSYVSNIDRKFVASRVPKSHPSHLKNEKPSVVDHTRKGYAMKNFVLRETYDFLKPSNYD